MWRWLLIKQNGFGRKRSWSLLGAFLEFAWKDWGQSRNIYQYRWSRDQTKNNWTHLTRDITELTCLVSCDSFYIFLCSKEWRWNPEQKIEEYYHLGYDTLHTQRCENLKSYKEIKEFHFPQPHKAVFHFPDLRSTWGQYNELSALCSYGYQGWTKYDLE
jgi:hypothetical protein